MACAGPSCYDSAMKAFVCEVDQSGLRRLVPEDLVPVDELGQLVRSPRGQPTTLVWALLADGDAEDLREDVRAGRHRAACGLLLNRAVELLSLGAAAGGIPRGVR